MTLLADPAERQFITRELHPTFGLEISDLDVSKALDKATVTALTELSARYKVLVFKGQSLSDFELHGFASQFGDTNQLAPSTSGNDVAHSRRRHHVSRLGAPEATDELIGKPEGYSNLARFWHSDSSWRAVPTWLTFLTPLELPDKGGNTQFADMEAAYAALSDERKALLERKHMIHCWDTMCRYEPSAIPMGKNCPPAATHPVVRTIDGRKSLFLSGHTGYYVGNMPFEEGIALYDELLAHATSPAFVYEHVWTLGDLLIWDNRRVMHRVLPHDLSQRRVMCRAEACGTEPPE